MIAVYIPSIHKHIPIRQYIDIWKKCKANPNTPVQQTLTRWSGGTTDDVIREIRQGIHDRINTKQTNFNLTFKYNQ